MLNISSNSPPAETQIHVAFTCHLPSAVTDEETERPGEHPGFFLSLFLAVRGHGCCAWASSGGTQRRLFLRRLTVVASLVEPRLQACASAVAARGLCGAALWLCSTGSVIVAQGLSRSAACGIFPDQG